MTKIAFFSVVNGVGSFISEKQPTALIEKNLKYQSKSSKFFFEIKNGGKTFQSLPPNGGIKIYSLPSLPKINYAAFLRERTSKYVSDSDTFIC